MILPLTRPSPDARAIREMYIAPVVVESSIRRRVESSTGQGCPGEGEAVELALGVRKVGGALATILIAGRRQSPSGCRSRNVGRFST